MEQSDLETLRERREALVLEREIAELEGAKVQEAESARVQQLLEVGQVIGNRLDYIYDSPSQGFGGLNSPADSIYGRYHDDRVDDRTEGRYRPVYEIEDDLARQRGIARVLAAVDEHGIGVVDTLANYTLGTGYVYEVSPKDPVNEPLAEVVQAIVDEFVERFSVKWRRKEREYHNRSRRDGEAFLKLDPIGGGKAEVEFVEPAEITEPTDTRQISEFAGFPSLDWTMGIGTDWGRPDRVHGYFQDKTGDQQDWDYIPADRMVHAKRNVDDRAKRGVSDFYPVWRDMERAAKVLRNSGEGAALQAAIAYIREHVPGVGLAAVQSMNSAKQVASIDQSWPQGNSTTSKFRKFNPGTILDVPAGQQYKPGPMGAERNEGFVTIAQSIWRSTGVRWLMPDYMITGDPSNGNFASTLVAESPFVKARQADQVWYAEDFTEVIWGVLRIAVNTSIELRRLGIQTVEQLRRLVKVNIEPPRVDVRNRSEDTQINSILSQRGLVSDRTWSGAEDLDYDHEQAQRDEEKPRRDARAASQAAAFGGFGANGFGAGGASAGGGGFAPVGRAGAGGFAGRTSGEQPQPLSRVGTQESLQAVAETADGRLVPISELESIWEDYP